MASDAAAPLPLRGAARNDRAYENLKELAADYIRRAIVSRDFAPGSKIDQDEIAETLRISRVPVREALIELAQKEFVVAIPRRGAFVAEVAVDDIEDHYEVLALVFGVATRRAVKQLTAADLAELRRLHTEIARSKDPARDVDLDRRFLGIIARAGSSDRLQSILTYLGGALPGSFYFGAAGSAANETRYRKALLAAIEGRDVRSAVRVSEEHLRACATIVVKHLRATGYWAEPAG
jgi:DNA-binding GntR family transcriptional regulator